MPLALRSVPWSSKSGLSEHSISTPTLLSESLTHWIMMAYPWILILCLTMLREGRKVLVMTMGFGIIKILCSAYYVPSVILSSHAQSLTNLLTRRIECTNWLRPRLPGWPLPNQSLWLRGGVMLISSSHSMGTLGGRSLEAVDPIQTFWFLLLG